MKDMTIVALDAMGGDNAPGEIVKGAVEALNESKDLFIYLVGKEEAVKKTTRKKSKLLIIENISFTDCASST